MEAGGDAPRPIAVAAICGGRLSTGLIKPSWRKWELFTEAGWVQLACSSEKEMNGTFGFIKFLLHRQEARQPGRRVHSSKLTLLVRWGRGGEEGFTEGWRHDKERENLLERARKTELLWRSALSAAAVLEAARRKKLQRINQLLIQSFSSPHSVGSSPRSNSAVN